ncbi:MAG: D-alanine--D-alanine ligase [Desulfovibrionaceae bacterium]|jgi:D-alanine-D-alanine ligase|nr:D-alanine--D-alanine ligase [Desulfovibrionaceae bacterium]
MRVILIAGGWSSERDVSLSGARGIGDALGRLGHTVVRFDLSEGFGALVTQAAQSDFAFINLHGSPGEDGLVQALLDRVGCPYQGAGPAGSFLALNKAAAKELFRSAGLRTPDWEFLPRPPAPGWRLSLPLPVFVKPNVGGSSLGMSMVREAAELGAALETVFAMGEEALVETLIPGVEITCSVLGDEPLPPILIRPKMGAFFDYKSKYELGGAEELCPAPVPGAVTRAVCDASLAAHRALGLTGVSRADFILSPSADGRDPFGGDLWLLEVNTLPGMTPTSLLPQSAAAVGYDFDALIARLMELGLAQRPTRRPGGQAPTADA